MTIKDKKYHYNIDLLGLILKNWQVQTLTSDPATTYARIYYNSVSQTFRIYNTGTTTWSDLGSGTEFVSAVSDTSEIDLTVSTGVLSGVLINGSVTLTRLAAIAANTVVMNNTGGSAVPTAVTVANLKTALAIVPGDITGFDTQVRTSTLNQMTAPTADLSINSHKLTNVTDPSSAQDAATKAYVDALGQGITWKTQVRAATTVNGTLATAYANSQVIDGVTLATGNRILLKDQTSGAENGIYVVAASGAPTRATDADVSAEMQGGVAVFIQEGTANGDSGWVMTNNGAVTLGSTSLVFARFTGLSDVISGAGLTKTGNSLDVIAGTTTGTGGPGGGLKVNADDVVVDTSVVVVKYATTIGDTTTTDFTITHNLATRDITLTVTDAASPFGIHDVYWEATTTNTATIFFPTAPATNELRVIIKA